MTNVLSALNAFEAATQYGLPAVNITVGNTGHFNPYSASKTCAETLGVMFVNDRDLRLNQVRAVNAYGPRQSMAAPFGSAKVRKITPAFVARALTGAPIEVYGDGKQISDMVHVTDVAKALVNALEYAAAGKIAPRVIEVGPAEHHTVLDVARLVQAAALRLGHQSAGFDVEHLPMRPGEIPGAHVVADTSTLPLIGLDAADFVPLDEGIADTVAWFAEHWLPGWLASVGGDCTVHAGCAGTSSA
jgi:UDP-glucose 4-epimerase